MSEILSCDVCLFILSAFLMIFAIAFGITQIKWANQSIKQLEQIRDRVEEVEPPKEG